MRIGLIAMSGVRVRTPELAELGVKVWPTETATPVRSVTVPWVGRAVISQTI